MGAQHFRKRPVVVEAMEWMPVLDGGGLYDVSDDGAIRSVVRRGSVGGLLKLYWRPDGYATVRICVDGIARHRRVNRLVLEAFRGPAAGLVARHIDGNPRNNNLDNLAWGTTSENQLDSVRHGTHRNPGSEKTECKNGHQFDVSNTYYRPDAGRSCRVCRLVASREYKRRVRLNRSGSADAIGCDGVAS